MFLQHFHENGTEERRKYKQGRNRVIDCHFSDARNKRAAQRQISNFRNVLLTLRFYAFLPIFTCHYVRGGRTGLSRVHGAHLPLVFAETEQQIGEKKVVRVPRQDPPFVADCSCLSGHLFRRQTEWKLGQ